MQVSTIKSTPEDYNLTICIYIELESYAKAPKINIDFNKLSTNTLKKHRSNSKIMLNQIKEMFFLFYLS